MKRHGLDMQCYLSGADGWWRIVVKPDTSRHPFPHLAEDRDVRRCEMEGNDYHVTLVLRRSTPTAATQAVLQEVVDFFGGHVWTMTWGVSSVSRNSVATLSPHRHLADIWPHILFLRAQAGGHPGPVTMSM